MVQYLHSRAIVSIAQKLPQLPQGMRWPDFSISLRQGSGKAPRIFFMASTSVAPTLAPTRKIDGFWMDKCKIYKIHQDSINRYKMIQYHNFRQMVLPNLPNKVSALKPHRRTKKDAQTLPVQHFDAPSPRCPSTASPRANT